MLYYAGTRREMCVCVCVVYNIQLYLQISVLYPTNHINLYTHLCGLCMYLYMNEYDPKNDMFLLVMIK